MIFEEKVQAYMTRMEDQQFCGFTREVIQTVENKIYESLGVDVQDCLKLSWGWSHKFQKRHGVKHFKFHGEETSTSLLDIKVDYVRIVAILYAALQQDNALGDIYNMDDTPLFFAATLQSGLAQCASTQKEDIEVQIDSCSHCECYQD